MNIDQVVAVLNNVAPQLKAATSGVEVSLADGGTIQFDGDDHGWTIRGTSGVKIAELKTEAKLFDAVRRSYVPQMVVHQVMVGQPISLPVEPKNFFWDFLYYASWKMFDMKEVEQQKKHIAAVRHFLQHYAPGSFQDVANKYFAKFKLEGV